MKTATLMDYRYPKRETILRNTYPRLQVRDVVNGTPI